MLDELTRTIEDGSTPPASGATSSSLQLSGARSEEGGTEIVCGALGGTFMLYNGSEYVIDDDGPSEFMTVVIASGQHRLERIDPPPEVTSTEIEENRTLIERHVKFYQEHGERLDRFFRQLTRVDKTTAPGPLQLALSTLWHKIEKVNSLPLPASSPLLDEKTENFFRDERKAESDTWQETASQLAEPARDVTSAAGLREETNLDQVQTEAQAMADRLNEARDVIFGILGRGAG